MQLSGVRAELAPWEAKIAAAKSRVDVATAERDLLLKQDADAQQRLKVLPPETTANSWHTKVSSWQCLTTCFVCRLDMAMAERSLLASLRRMQCPRTLHLHGCSRLAC